MNGDQMISVIFLEHDIITPIAHFLAAGVVTCVSSDSS